MEIVTDLLKGVFEDIEDGSIKGMKLWNSDNYQNIIFPNGELSAVVGDTSSGKSSLLRTFVLSNQNNKVLYFTGGKKSKHVVRELLISNAKQVPKAKLDEGYLGCGDIGKLANSGGRLHKSHIMIDDTIGLTVSKIRDVLEESGDVEAIVIDDLSRMYSSIRQEHRLDQYDSIMRELKELVSELDIPIIVSSQMSYNKYQPNSKRSLFNVPRFVREFSDTVIMVYREALYLDQYDTDYDEKLKLAELLVVKSSVGETKEVSSLWNSTAALFEEYIEPEEVVDHW